MAKGRHSGVKPLPLRQICTSGHGSEPAKSSDDLLQRGFTAGALAVVERPVCHPTPTILVRSNIGSESIGKYLACRRFVSAVIDGQHSVSGPNGEREAMVPAVNALATMPRSSWPTVMVRDGLIPRNGRYARLGTKPAQLDGVRPLFR
jgi:hypothetical protein